MAFSSLQVLSILLVIVTGVLCSGTQQGVSSTQAGHTLQIQSSNARKYNKHTTTESESKKKKNENNNNNKKKIIIRLNTC